MARQDCGLRIGNCGINWRVWGREVDTVPVATNDAISPLFEAVIEAI
jgi:hypothetical protein